MTMTYRPDAKVRDRFCKDPNWIPVTTMQRHDSWLGDVRLRSLWDGAIGPVLQRRNKCKLYRSMLLPFRRDVLINPTYQAHQCRRISKICFKLSILMLTLFLHMLEPFSVLRDLSIVRLYMLLQWQAESSILNALSSLIVCFER
jgi:hypothetical protein